jgi:hypothetical protein
MMEFLIVDSDMALGMRCEGPFFFFASTVAGCQYLNFLDGFFTPLVAGDTPSMFTFAKYEIKGDRVILCLADHDGAEAAIDQGKLKGTIATFEGKRANNSSVEITSTTDELRRYLIMGGDHQLFPPPPQIILSRVK